MPTIKIIDSIKIDIYSREHPPPHFHVRYAEYEELILMETFETYAGYLPSGQRKKIIDWAKEHQALLIENFHKLNPGL